MKVASIDLQGTETEILNATEEAATMAVAVMLFARRTAVELLGVPATDVTQVNHDDGLGCDLVVNGAKVFTMKHIQSETKVQVVGEWLIRAAAPRLAVPTPDGTGKVRL